MSITVGAVIAGKVEQSGVNAGEAGNDNTEHNALQKKSREAICLPEDDFGEKV